MVGLIKILQKKHWDAHELAFKGLSRNSKNMVAKLIHKLINTNRQNHKFYGKSALSPSCQPQRNAGLTSSPVDLKDLPKVVKPSSWSYKKSWPPYTPQCRMASSLDGKTEQILGSCNGFI